MQLKPGRHKSCKDRKDMFENMFFQVVQKWLGLCIVVMIPGIDVTEKIFASDMLRA